MIGFEWVEWVEWVEDRRPRNIEDHGVDFRLAALIFDNSVIEARDERDGYGDPRHRALGHTGDA